MGEQKRRRNMRRRRRQTETETEAEREREAVYTVYTALEIFQRRNRRKSM